MNVIEAINNKRAVRQFTEQNISDADLKTILNAGRRAGSSKNSQPWHFIVLRDRERLQALSEYGTYAGHLAGANLGVAMLTVPFENRWSIMFDLGRAAQNMMLTAWDLGIGSVMATIYEPEKARALFQFPDDLMMYVAISFGYPVENPANRPARKNMRRSFEDVVHWEQW